MQVAATFPKLRRVAAFFATALVSNEFITYLCKEKAMPTVFILFGYIFKFYANDHEPLHIHVLKDGHKAKFSLFPVNLVENQGFKPAEIKLVESIIDENEEIIAQHWNRFFNKVK